MGCLGSEARMLNSFPQALSWDQPHEHETLSIELQAAKAELGALRNAQDILAAKRHESEQRRIEDWSAKIRASTQHVAALQAQQQMVRAHLLALSAMTSGAANQISSRQSVLQGLLQQVEEHEASALQAQESLKEHVDSPSTWGVSKSEVIEDRAQQHQLKQRMEELSTSCSRLQDEVACLHHEEQQHRHTEAAEVDKLTNQANSAEESCSTIASELRELSAASDVLEELMDRREKSTDGLNRSVTRLRGVCSELRQYGLPDNGTVFSSLVASLETSLCTAKLLAAEEQDLKSQRTASEARLELLRSEAVEREYQFSTITQDLQTQVSHLLEKISFAEEASHRQSHRRVSARPPPGHCQADDMDLTMHGMNYANRNHDGNMFSAVQAAHDVSNNLLFEPTAATSTTHREDHGCNLASDISYLRLPDEHIATRTPSAPCFPTSPLVSPGLPTHPVASSSRRMPGDVAPSEPVTGACLQQPPQQLLLLSSQQPLGLSQQQLRARQQLQDTPWLSSAPPSLNSVGPGASTPPSRARPSGPGPLWPRHEFEAGDHFEERISELQDVIGESLRTLEEEERSFGSGA
eukprot:TRINITY_DN21360_c0_g1_i1.p1 TRINITY_DN21360_c0_g1~~TRINITY_DN21360_c0_g1_i1.p1  ORF type:complete len:581 (+),score=120.13 TRINITY_DN21360_c0_g1_i1:104-1846(+)